MSGVRDPSRMRAPILALSITGLLISSYLTLYQWGVFGSVWEPFFGDGSRAVLHSSLAKRLPIPDAALGAVMYLLEASLDAVGGTDRWRTMPWIVALFGLCAASLGAVSVLLVILQPLAFGHWCTFCLCSGAISITIAILAFDEIRAMVQQLRRVARQGRSPWRALAGQSDWPSHVHPGHQKGGM
jgi:uncharacterized membrane protein